MVITKDRNQEAMKTTYTFVIDDAEVENMDGTAVAALQALERISPYAATASFLLRIAIDNEAALRGESALLALASLENYNKETA